MANYQAGHRIVSAVRSVLTQTEADLELIVSDDASSDGSLALLDAVMAGDSRVRVVTAAENGGPARCRNRALDLARGDWIAIVDSDDIIHPERLERLLAAADERDAQIVADDMLLFFEDGAPPRLLLGPDDRTAFSVSVEQWLRAGSNGNPALGYLKPLIRASTLGSLRYDETLRIGEDHDLVLRLLLGGATMMVVPEPFYLYRRHSGSISHRLSVVEMEAMIARQKTLVEEHPDIAWPVQAAFASRERGLRQGLAYQRLVRALKSRKPFAALSEILADPAHLGRLWRSFSEGRQGRRPPAPREVSPLLMLGSGGTPGASQTVPDYVPVRQTDWTSPRPRAVWRDLAARRGLGAIRCIPLDRAGLYAAGFIPEAEILPLPPSREAS